MEVNKDKEYQVRNYKYKNFVKLSEEEIENVRVWRNHPSIRKVMYNTDEISPDQHMNFIKGLYLSNDKFYWLVFKEDIPIGVLNIIEIENNDESGQLGYYLLPSCLESGLGMDFISTSILFLIKEIGVKKIFGRTELSNSNALAINYHIGFRFRPETININEMTFIEQDLLASDFIERYERIYDSKELIKSIKEFNKIYKTYKS